jgi:ATPase subunit of ABC transporter with duplicated ATPase domains
LSGYQGALLVASHDRGLLDEIGVTRLAELASDGRCRFRFRTGS